MALSGPLPIVVTRPRQIEDDFETVGDIVTVVT